MEGFEKRKSLRKTSARPWPLFLYGKTGSTRYQERSESWPGWTRIRSLNEPWPRFEKGNTIVIGKAVKARWWEYVLRSAEETLGQRESEIDYALVQDLCHWSQGCARRHWENSRNRNVGYAKFYHNSATVPVVVRSLKTGGRGVRCGAGICNDASPIRMVINLPLHAYHGIQIITP